MLSGGPGLRFGYMSGVATDRFLLALFSGHTRGGGTPAPQSGEYLHVFDWDGDLHAVLRLDASVASIVLSADGETLYAAVSDSIPSIRSYPLPLEFRSAR